MYNSREAHDAKHYVNTGLPVVATKNELFQLTREIGGEVHKMQFNRDVHWVARHQSNVSLFHKGVLVKEISTLVDGDGPNDYLKAIEDLGALKRLQEHYRIDSNTDLELAEISSIVIFPVMVTTASRQREEDDKVGFRGGLRGRDWYSRVPGHWQVEKGGEFAPFEGDRPRLVVQEKTWSSNLDDEASDFYKRWTPDHVRSYLKENGLPDASQCLDGT